MLIKSLGCFLVSAYLCKGFALSAERDVVGDKQVDPFSPSLGDTVSEDTEILIAKRDTVSLDDTEILLEQRDVLAPEDSTHLWARQNGPVAPVDDSNPATDDDIYEEQGALYATAEAKRSKINVYSSNPVHTGDKATCKPYEYLHVFSGKTLLGRVRAVGATTLDNYYVRQSAYGDCGFGAAMLALAYSGRSDKIINSLRRVTGAVANRDWTVTMQRHGATSRIVRIDDQFPFSSEKGCQNYNSFWPCNNNVGAKCSANAQYFQIPMLEKAFAKYFDAYPDLRSSKAKKLDSTGYAGLRGIRPYIVLEAMTGESPKSATLLSDKAAGFKARLQAIVSRGLPATVGTPNATDFGGLIGTTARNAEGRLVLTTTGLTATQTSAKSARGFTVAYSQHSFTLAGPHWYAVSIEDSTSTTLAVRNPWGANVDTTGSRTKTGNGLTRIPMDIAARIFKDVHWIE